MVVPGSSKREQTLKLIAEKDKIESQISEFGKILEQNHVNMTETLVDEDGFPRSDIDVYQVRHARHQIICLQNDLKSLMEQIKKGLEEVHAESSQNKSLSPKLAGLVTDETPSRNNFDLISFAKINFIAPGSPAEDAGLAVNDEIIEFGSINSKNFVNLTTIGEIVKHKQNQKILLKIKRKGQGRIIETNLIPRTWRGKGLLGCNIVLPDAMEMEH